MAGRFVLRRSTVARAQAQRDLDASTERISKLVALSTSLADRMEAMPTSGVDRDRDRRARVQLLRGAAEAGVRMLDVRGCGHGPLGGQQRAGA